MTSTKTGICLFISPFANYIIFTCDPIDVFVNIIVGSFDLKNYSYAEIIPKGQYTTKDTLRWTNIHSIEYVYSYWILRGQNIIIRYNTEESSFAVEKYKYPGCSEWLGMINTPNSLTKEDVLSALTFGLKTYIKSS